MEASKFGCEFSIALTIVLTPFLSSLVMIAFLTLSTVGLIAILIAPFVGWLQSKNDEQKKERLNNPLSQNGFMATESIENDE